MNILSVCLSATSLFFFFFFSQQEVEQLRLERMQIDEQLRQITQGYRPADRERGGGGYNPESGGSAPHSSRSYNSRGRGRRGHNYNPGYGTQPEHTSNIRLTKTPSDTVINWS